MEATDEVRAALRRAGAVVSWLFGSRAGGTAQPGSDVDVALLTPVGASPVALLDLADLAGVLEGLLGAPVDLVDSRRAPLELRARIVTTGRVLHSDDDVLRVRTVVITQSFWEDVRPGLAIMDRAYVAAVAERGFQARPTGRG